MASRRKKLCFVIMPFHREMREVYDAAIKPACENAGYRSLRVDELEGVFNINKKIIQHIFKSDAIIADLTGWRPNVFYEMGVAHAIDNKTIMIIQEKDKVPFDVSTYSCIQYTQDTAGLAKLREQITGFLRRKEEWCQDDTNPVQEYKPHDAFMPKARFEALAREVAEKNVLLEQTVPLAEFEALQKALQEKEVLLRQSVSQSDLRALQNELSKKEKAVQQARAQLETAKEALKQKTAAISALKSRLQPEAPAKKPVSKPKIALRAKPVEKLSTDAVKKMLGEKDFFDWSKNKGGTGVAHEYALQESDGEKVVVDRATGLMWQQSGSPETMDFTKAEKFIKDLNGKKFAGFSDWRLPALEEAMSLMEREKKHGDLYIDPVFDKTQRWIWTADKSSAEDVWVFYYGRLPCLRRLLRSRSSLVTIWAI